MVDSYFDRKFMLMASKIQSEINALGMGAPVHENKNDDNYLTYFDQFIKDEGLKKSCRELFANSHYAQAVEQAFKCLNNAVKEKSLTALDGDSLMRKSFSPDNPILKLNQLKTQSDKDEQRGYMDLYAGSITGIRNPRAHEHRLEDNPQSALEMIVIANHLLGKLTKAKRVHRKRVK